MSLYNPLGPNKGEVVVMLPNGLDKLLDFSDTWYVNEIVVGNLIMQKALGDNYQTWPDVECIVNEVPDNACYAVAYVEDYNCVRNQLLTDYVTVFYHTLICTLVMHEREMLLSNKMQLLKLSMSGVCIYHEP